MKPDFTRAHAVLAARLMASLKEQAEAIATAARSTLPEGPLRNSITVQADAQGFIVRCNAPHAAFVEIGTHKTVPRPFLGPAYLEVSRLLSF